MRQESEPVYYPYSFGLDLDEPMIGCHCEMQEACNNHEWFHYRWGIHKRISLKYSYAVKCAKTNGSATCKMVTSIVSVKKIDRMKTHWLNAQPKESVSIVGYTMLHVWIWMKCMYQIYGFAPLHAIMNQQAEVRDGGERKCQ